LPYQLASDPLLPGADLSRAKFVGVFQGDDYKVDSRIFSHNPITAIDAVEDGTWLGLVISLPLVYFQEVNPSLPICDAQDIGDGRICLMAAGVAALWRGRWDIVAALQPMFDDLIEAIGMCECHRTIIWRRLS
jgi:hypothetical protein